MEQLEENLKSHKFLNLLLRKFNDARYFLESFKCCIIVVNILVFKIRYLKIYIIVTGPDVDSGKNVILKFSLVV
jgi:hypothetical protein